MFYDPEQIVSFETAKILKSKVQMLSPHVEGPLESISDLAKIAKYVAYYKFYDDNGNIVECHQSGYDKEFDKAYRNKYGAIHKTYYMTYAPSLFNALDWIRQFHHLTFDIKNEETISENIKCYKIIVTYNNVDIFGNHIFAIKVLMEGADGNDAIEKCIRLLFKNHLQKTWLIPEMLRNVLEIYPFIEQYISETELYKWMDCSDDNYWLEVPGYASIVQIDGRVIAHSNCEYSWSDIVRFNGKLMHVEL